MEIGLLFWVIYIISLGLGLIGTIILILAVVCLVRGL